MLGFVLRNLSYIGVQAHGCAVGSLRHIFELDQDIHATLGGSIVVKKSPSVTKENERPTTNYEAAAVPAIGDSPI